MEETVLNGRFQMLPSCSTHFDVTLSRHNIMFTEHCSTTSKQQRKLTSILMDNVVGCKMYNSKLSHDVCSYFKVSSKCPQPEKLMSKISKIKCL